MILICTHAVFLDGKDIYGPPHAVSLFLNKKKIAHLFVKHDLYGKLPTVVETYEKGQLTHVKKSDIQSTNTLVRYVKEALFNYQLAKKNGPLALYFGVDPLNGFLGPLLKLSSTTKASIYFCADFAIKRFDQWSMNTLYHFLDTFCMFFTDQTLSISSRVVDYRRTKGLSESKNKRLPNAPFFDTIRRLPDTKVNRFQFVIVSALEKGIDFMTLLEAFKLVHDENKKTQLHFIGSGSLEKKIKAKADHLSLKKSVFFHGALSHEQMFEKIVQYGVGIALYSDSDPNHFRYFSDPMKVRDYLASGLPVIVSGNSAITDEIEKEKVGFSVTLHTQDLMKKMDALISNEQTYFQYRKRALKLAKKYDTSELLKTYLSKYLI